MQVLARYCFGIDQLAGAERSHEDRHLLRFTTDPIMHHSTGACEIHVQFLPRRVYLTHADVQLSAPLTIQIAETRVAVPVWMRATVLLPEQCQRHSRPAQ